MNWNKIILRSQQVLGYIYLIAGVGKFVPQIEAVDKTLLKAYNHNKGTMLEDISHWFYINYWELSIFIAIAMVASGICQVTNKFLVRSACFGQILMCFCFMIFLHRAYPIIYLVDIPCIALAGLIIYWHTKYPGFADTKKE